MLRILRFASCRLRSPEFVSTGDSIELKILTGQVINSMEVVTNYGVTPIYMLDHTLSGGTGEREVASSRLVVGSNGVWDQTLHTAVTIPQVS